MKKILAVFLLLVLLVPHSCFGLDGQSWARMYNILAESMFNVPSLDVDSFYTLPDSYTGGTASVWHDDNVIIGFISGEEEYMIGALCADRTNDDAAFLLRCICLIYTFDTWEKYNYQVLFDGYVHVMKDPSEVYIHKLYGDNHLVMFRGTTGLAAYILGE